MTALCETAAKTERFMAENGPRRWIVKPCDGLAGIAVSLVKKVDDLPGALAKFGAPPAQLGSLPAGRAFLSETFVDGPEHSAEGVVVGGVRRY